MRQEPGPPARLGLVMYKINGDNAAMLNDVELKNCLARFERAGFVILERLI